LCQEYTIDELNYLIWVYNRRAPDEMIFTNNKNANQQGKRRIKNTMVGIIRDWLNYKKTGKLGDK